MQYRRPLARIGRLGAANRIWMNGKRSGLSGGDFIKHRLLRRCNHLLSPNCVILAFQEVSLGPAFNIFYNVSFSG